MSTARLVGVRLARPEDASYVTVSGPRGELRIVLSGRPVDDDEPPAGHLLDEHLAVDGTESPWAPIADVLVHRGRRPAEFHGLVACAVEPDGTCTIASRDERVVFTATPRTALWLASVAHSWLVTGRGLGTLASVAFTHRRVPAAGHGWHAPGGSPVRRR